MQIKILHKQGKSLRAIACEVGCSVNTVRKYLAAQDPPTFRPAAAPRESIVVPFEEYLRERIAAAAPDWIPAAVLWREIQSMGFDGGERIVRKFVATLRPTQVADPLVRFETAAGDQMQVDWVEFRRRKAHGIAEFELGHVDRSWPNRWCVLFGTLRGIDHDGGVRQRPLGARDVVLECHLSWQ